ncbi:MAG: F0F1 ATP synthase subunit gamma [Cyanobium sp. MAG06]|nr:F0F1 ATP synthase subunit gamma [Cyanobium sp. MAG06]
MQQRAIKNKIKSTTSIKKITRTMEMISVTKMRKSMLVSENYKSFIKRGAEIINILVKDKSEIKNIFNNKNNNSNKDLYIVIGGQKGMCGSFNVNIYRAISKQLQDNKGIENDYISINKYGERICKRFINNTNNKNSNGLIYSFNKKSLTESDYHIILKYITDSYKNNTYKNVYLVWTAFENVAKQEVNIVSLLPFY